MRSLVAVLLILATPLCAQAGGRWGEGRGARAAVYGPGRPMGAQRGPAYPPPPPPVRQGPYGPAPPPVRQGPYGPPPQAAFAGPPRSQQERAREAVRAGRRVPLPFVIERLQRRLGAEYVDMREVRDPSGRPMYVVRLRQRGRYIDVPVDAETGEVQR